MLQRVWISEIMVVRVIYVPVTVNAVLQVIVNAIATILTVRMVGVVKLARYLETVKSVVVTVSVKRQPVSPHAHASTVGEEQIVQPTDPTVSVPQVGTGGGAILWIMALIGVGILSRLTRSSVNISTKIR